MSDVAVASKSSSTVSIASKLPFPLRLQLQKSLSRVEDAFGGGVREVETRIKYGQTIVIDGWARKVGEDTDKHIAGGFALTHGVDADFWNEWKKQNAGFAPLENGLIFAAGKESVIADKAKEMRSLKSGFEPADPANVPDEFKAKIIAA
jgi:hypothetical protein